MSLVKPAENLFKHLFKDPSILTLFVFIESLKIELQCDQNLSLSNPNCVMIFQFGISLRRC